MTPKLFAHTYYPYAKKVEAKTGINAVFILAQAALESGWGEYAPGNAFFGVKSHSATHENDQLITTTEYSRRSDLKFPEIISCEPCTRNGQKYFRYRVKDYFRAYETPEDCFNDHVSFFFDNPRYKNALVYRNDGPRFAKEVAEAGYATDPNYADLLGQLISKISHELVF